MQAPRKAIASQGGSARAPVKADRRQQAISSTADEHHREEDHGRRLLKAFDALATFPVLTESRDCLLAAISEDHVVTAELVAAVESDVALIIAVLRLANRRECGDGQIDTVISAVQQLPPETIHAAAACMRAFDFFESAGGWGVAPERFRQHALATQRIADRLAATVNYESRDRLSVTSLLHDIGKLVLLHAYPGCLAKIDRKGGTPEERVHQERRELGIDHALVGGVLARRWGLPKSVYGAIEQHHSCDSEGDAAFIRLADMLAHHEQSARISPSKLLASARAIGIEPDELRRVMYELPSSTAQRKRTIDPCPLTARELSILRLLAESKVYKQIGKELELATSTVRTHLHNTYYKLGAADRAQAVLIATERGWL
jgi:putative nucleotidyltransferase with HDIG domain